MECVFLFGPIVGAGEMVVSEMVFMFPFDIFFFEWSMQTIDQSRTKANVVYALGIGAIDGWGKQSRQPHLQALSGAFVLKFCSAYGFVLLASPLKVLFH